MMIDHLPPLNFPPLPTSPANSSCTSSASNAFVVSFTTEDGLMTDEEITYHFHDREQRQALIQNMGHIALRVQSRPAKQKLFTALEVLCDYDDCAMSIAQQLPALVEVTGTGTSAFLEGLRPLVLQLCCNMDTSVVLEATEAIRQLFMISDDMSIEEVLCPLIIDLVGSPWNAPRSVGAGLLVEAARHMNPADLPDIQQKYIDCCTDSAIQVRRAACRSLAAWFRVVGPQVRSSFLYPLFNGFLTEGKHDTIQIELVSQVVLVGNIIGRHDATKYLIHIFHALCCHRGWRVRYSAAIQIAVFAQLTLKPEDLVDDVLAMARDEETEIVAAVLKQLHLLVSIIPSTTVEHKIVPGALRWVTSDVPLIRCAIAQSLFSIIISCRPSPSSHQLLAQLLALVDDPSELVQTTTVASFSRLTEFVTTNSDASQLWVSSICKAASSDRWRLRAAVAQQTANLATSLSEPHFHFMRQVLRDLVVDRVAAVRTSAISSLGVIARQYGPMWSAEMFCFLLDSAVLSTERCIAHYWVRVVVAYCIGALLPIAAGIHKVVAEELHARVERHALRLIPALSMDPISNVRVAAARAVLILRTCRCSIGSSTVERIHVVLSADSDPDVVRAANVITDAPF